MTRREEIVWSTGADLTVPPALVGDVLAHAADIVIAIDRAGVVQHVLTNPGDGTLGCLDHWIGRDLRTFLTEECLPKLDALLEGLSRDSGSRPRSIDLNHIDNASWEFPIHYTAIDTGPEGMILLIGRDLRPVAEMQQQLVRTQLALEKDYEVYRQFDTRYRVVMAASRDALLIVDAATGRIDDANVAAALLLGTDLETLSGAAFAQEFTDRHRAEFMEALNAAAASNGTAPVVAEAKRNRVTTTIFPTVFRAAGRNLLLCRLESGARTEPSEELSTNLHALFGKGMDAVVFTDMRGMIRGANEAFLNLCDIATAAGLNGKSLGDFLVRGGVDVKILIENAARSGRMRTFATKIATAFGAQRPVEISATYLNDRPDPAIAFVLREVTQPTSIPAAATSDVAKNVMGLVGASPLKEIVAATADVVEKLCIETAVELTRNNRVAAAEMLGLSRQSLYVKLRKYDLLDKNGGRD